MVDIIIVCVTNIQKLQKVFRMLLYRIDLRIKYKQAELNEHIELAMYQIIMKLPFEVL